MGITYHSFKIALDAMQEAGLIVQNITRGEHRDNIDPTTGEVRTVRERPRLNPHRIS